MDIVRKMYKEKGVSLVVSGTKGFYTRKWDEEGGTLYITSGDASANEDEIKLNKEGETYWADIPSYGVLTIWNKTSFTYEQKSIIETAVDSVFYMSGSNSQIGKGNEKYIALVVLLCSLAFLCYFVYSWISCYLKKPRVRRDENEGDGYAMQSIDSNV